MFLIKAVSNAPQYGKYNKGMSQRTKVFSYQRRKELVIQKACNRGCVIAKTKLKRAKYNGNYITHYKEKQWVFAKYGKELTPTFVAFYIYDPY